MRGRTAAVRRGARRSIGLRRIRARAGRWVTDADPVTRVNSGARLGWTAHASAQLAGVDGRAVVPVVTRGAVERRDVDAHTDAVVARIDGARILVVAVARADAAPGLAAAAASPGP